MSCADFLFTALITLSCLPLRRTPTPEVVLAAEMAASEAKGSKQENIARNISSLFQLGVPEIPLCTLLMSDTKLVSGTERFEESLKIVVEMGLDPTRPKFVEAVNVFYSLSEKTREEKVAIYTSLGFAVGDVWDIFRKFPRLLAFSERNILSSAETFAGLGFSKGQLSLMVKRHPACLSYAAESVEKKIEFVVNKMKWTLEAVVSNPQVLGLSMEKRIVPRGNVIKALMCKGLLGSEEPPPIMSVLVVSDERFLNKYVTNRADKEVVAELMCIFTAGDRVAA